jgi:S-formylglutathione hydrolase
MNRTPTSLLIVFFFSLFTLSGYSQFVKKKIQESPIYSGSTDVKDVYSPALEGNLQGNPSTQPVIVYLPPFYENFPENKYPVVYLLHQFTTDYNLYFEEYNIDEKLDRLISQKTISPMIVVTPNAKTIFGGSWYTNSYVSGNWEDYITNDVFQHIASQYEVLDQPESRGMAGFSSAGYGTMNIAMKHPATLGSIATIGLGLVDMESFILNDPFKSWTIEAANINEFRPGDPWYIHASYSNAEAFAPDSTAKPILGRLPYTAEGDIVDSTWQEWMEHDPITRIDIYKDSLLKLNTIQIYIGNQDDMHVPGHETLHQAMIDNGIEHGYITYIGGHDPEPVLEDLLSYFSESLLSVVPTVISLSEYSLMVSDTLVLKSDMSGKLYIVPDTVYPAIDSIIKYQSTTADVIADEEKEINLSEFEIGNYLVYAISNENMASNIPAEFSLVPATSISYPITDQSNTLSVEIFPIPTSEDIILLIGTQDPYELSITSLNGQLIKMETFRESRLTLDISSFQKGIYFITIRSRDFVTTRKIIKL